MPHTTSQVLDAKHPHLPRVARFVEIMSSVTRGHRVKHQPESDSCLVPPASPMAKMKPPAVPEQPVPILTDDELRRLLEAAKGTEFDARRDTAILRVFVDTGCRSDEIATLTVDGVDFDQDVLPEILAPRLGEDLLGGLGPFDRSRRSLSASDRADGFRVNV